ncbi:peroxiredoxin [Agromyces sp. S2-1-8]|uniref:peroxiredoxin family protein n=1 Tax=Agromyces sp. S2-1-8 TaxID=2897180 RepID=UPI001E570610|nr:redoxin domain-containing protein [Agromyces sp. S2-1-8]MCD5348205.1 peroxiredoxin family protein [Agromyces sp. S2-1-8]
MITAGTRMPNLELQSSTGEPVRLLDHLGERGMVAFFMRTTTCPVCNAHVRDLVGRAGELSARGISVLIAVPEDRDEAAAWKDRRRVPFPVVTGADGTAHEAVGLTKRVFGSMQQSGTVLVDAAGLVRHAHGSTLPTAGYDRRALLAAIDELAPAARV